jgi:hypothetical protein
MNVVIVFPTSPTQSQYSIKLPTSPEKIKAGDIAISLSVIEGDCYNKITQADYMAHLRGTSITDHIESATQINNRIVNWVKMNILRSGSVCAGVYLCERRAETPVLSSEDVNKRSANFKRFVLTADVPANPLVMINIYSYTLSGMQKTSEFLIHVRDRRRAAVGPTASPDAREQAHEERETALAPTGRDPLSGRRPSRVPRSPTKHQVPNRHPVVGYALSPLLFSSPRNIHN